MKKLNSEQIQFIAQTVEGYVQEMQYATESDIDAAIEAAINSLDCGNSGATAFSDGVRQAMTKINERRARAKVIKMTDYIKKHMPVLQAG